MALPPDRVRTFDRTGGTILHTSRTNPSNVKPEDVPGVRPAGGPGRPRPDGRVDCTRHVLRVLDHLGLEALIPIGGDDTLSFASRLHQEDFRVVAIPKTMDNDVFGTDYCIGFSTAVTRSVDAITNFRTSVGSHERIGVVELFGRNSGETSLYAAYLARRGSRAHLRGALRHRAARASSSWRTATRNPSNYALLTISEGAHPKGGAILESGEEDAYGHKKLGRHRLPGRRRRSRSAAASTSCTSSSRTSCGRARRTRWTGWWRCRSARWRCDQVAMGHTGRMVALQQGIYTTVPLDMVVAGQEARGRDGALRLAELPAARARHARQADVPVLVDQRLTKSTTRQLTPPFPD